MVAPSEQSSRSGYRPTHPIRQWRHRIMVTYSFPGKVVLVTGSSRGMGAVTLEAFAAAGAVCVVNYYPDPGGVNLKDAEDTASRLRSRGAAVHVIPCDV